VASAGRGGAWRSLGEFFGRFFPSDRAAMQEKVEADFRRSLEEAEAMKELMASDGWKILAARVRIENEVATRKILLSPPVSSEMDPSGAWRDRQREWWCGEVAGRESVISLPEQIIDRAERLTQGGKQQ